MTVDVNLNVRFLFPQLDSIAAQITELKEFIVPSMTEVIEQLTALVPVVQKIGGETEQSLALIQQLQDQIAQMGDAAPQALIDIANQLAVQLKVVDDLVPDLPPAG